MRLRQTGMGLFAVVLLAMGTGASARGGGWQQNSAGQAPMGAVPNPALTTRDRLDPAQEKMQEQQAMTLAEQRHKRLVADADRLLQLATELKEEVDKSTKNEMSIPTIKKAAEMEKLAHDVKERMKGQ